MTTIHESGHGSSALTGTRTLLHRVLLTYRHSPALLFVTLTAPLGMMLLFGFVFAGALSGGDGATYRAYLMPGVLVLVAAMGLATTAATAHMGGPPLWLLGGTGTIWWSSSGWLVSPSEAAMAAATMKSTWPSDRGVTSPATASRAARSCSRRSRGPSWASTPNRWACSTCTASTRPCWDFSTTW